MESVGGYAGIISNGNEILTDKYGVYMRIGYVYVVVIAAVALGQCYMEMIQVVQGRQLLILLIIL